MYVCIQLLQLTLLDQSLKLKGVLKAAASSSTWYPNISFIQMAQPSWIFTNGRGRADFDEFINKTFHATLRSCLVVFYFGPTTLISIAVCVWNRKSCERRAKGVWTTAGRTQAHNREAKMAKTNENILLPDFDVNYILNGFMRA